MTAVHVGAGFFGDDIFLRGPQFQPVYKERLKNQQQRLEKDTNFS